MHMELTFWKRRPSRFLPRSASAFVSTLRSSMTASGNVPIK